MAEVSLLGAFWANFVAEISQGAGFGLRPFCARLKMQYPAETEKNKHEKE